MIAPSLPISNLASERTVPPRLWLVLLCAWLLILNTFSAPGREGPESAAALDWIALAKVVVRVGSLAALGALWMRLGASPRRGLVLGALLPLGLFLGWAVLSALWSPLKSVSLGQAMGLIVQVMLAAALGVLCDRPRHASVVLKHLSLALLTISVIVLAVDLIDHGASGLNRAEEHAGAAGIIHPTDAGSTSALGILILVAARLMWGWRWSVYLLWPGLLIHGTLLILAASRTAMGLTLVLLPLMVGIYGSRVLLAGAIFLGCAAGAAYLTVDADMALAREALEETGDYASRGESTESLTSLTGRTALWYAIGREVQKSPVWGHGYFVTAESGELDVWYGGPAQLTAHNILLQVLVSTGLVGLTLFLAGFLWPLARVAKALRSEEDFHLLGQFLLLFALWYLGWGQLSSSFMGAIQPESVVFFALFGLALGVLRLEGRRRAGASAL